MPCSRTLPECFTAAERVYLRMTKSGVQTSVARFNGLCPIYICIYISMVTFQGALTLLKILLPQVVKLNYNFI